MQTFSDDSRAKSSTMDYPSEPQSFWFTRRRRRSRRKTRELLKSSIQMSAPQKASFVECWAHGSRFDVRTGEPDELPAIIPVKTYPVRVDGERVLVDVDAPKTSQKETV